MALTKTKQYSALWQFVRKTSKLMSGALAAILVLQPAMNQGALARKQGVPVQQDHLGRHLVDARRVDLELLEQATSHPVVVDDERARRGVLPFERAPLRPPALNPLSRDPIAQPIGTGVRAIDAPIGVPPY